MIRRDFVLFTYHSNSKAMNQNRNVEILQAAFDAINRNDLDTLRKYVDENIRYVIRGRGSVSGEFRGIDEFLGIMSRIKGLTDGTMTAHPGIILSDGDHVMAYYRITGQRPDGREYDQHHAYLYTFTNGKMNEGQTIPVDQYMFDSFFN